MEFAKLLFWILMILWLIGGFFLVDGTWRGYAPHLIVWILFALLGWAVFGNPFG